MHPMVKPALRRAWRNLRLVQFGATPAHAVVVGPVDTATGGLIALLDGTRGMELLRAEARALGLPDGRLEGLLGRLAAAGLIADASAQRPGKAGAPGPGDPRLDPLRADLASLSVVHPEADGAPRRLAARRALRVQVRGAGRVGAAVAALLSASGVGRVDVLDSGVVEPWEVSPGGLPAEAVGERRAVAAHRLVGRAAPGGRLPRAPRAGPGESGGEPGISLVVVTPRDGLGAYVPDPLPAHGWLETGTPHLYAGVLEATGVVGPLVLPGATACAGCVQEERTDREPYWPRMLAQWRSGPPPPLPACDLALATAVAGLAAAHALAFLDGGLPASTGTRWETSLPLLEWRTERLRPHPACPCGAVRHEEGEHATGATTPQDTMAG
ncbi:ThiF family adenylyltransferase [Streptomyces sp. ms191]|uniref:TOMM precursor leader peptide-binding protein n=1 Tax=unclassified Streptomyces TaxID=2593676 RepID=UPI0011CDDC06|nr:TOMM precursor leader peptide-binding protein [Streptomyces sp. ms191]TXS20982.1 ThiF family adenylyltransferase [Streptomyces sp. ms191]